MISKRLKELRVKHHLTQIELSRATGIGNKTISDYERGISDPDSATIKLFADYFNVSTDYLLGKENLKPELKGSKLALYDQMNELTEEQAKDVLNFIEFIKNKEMGG